MKKRRRYMVRAVPVTPSVFSEHAHRWPEAGEPMAYAMACVEVVANESSKAGELYRELVKAWAAPGVRGFYEEFMANVPEEDVLEWKRKFRNPGLTFLPDPNKPFEDLARLGASLDSVFGSDEVAAALEGAESTPEVAATARLFGLISEFINAGFNREKDLKRGVVRVPAWSEPPWLMLMVLYRSGLEYGGITPERLDKIYKVRQVKGKWVDYGHVMANEPMSRRHRQVVKASKKAGLKLRHDNKFLDAAWVWYQCRIVHATVDDFLDEHAAEEDFRLYYKNAQNLVRLCDDAIGFRKRLAKPSK